MLQSVTESSQSTSSHSETEEVSAKELLELCALDSMLFGRTFFPRTFRQRSPAFHVEVLELLDDSQHRYVGLEIFRDGAKTTLVRVNAAKRISYGTSRTILIVGASQAASERSLKWIKGQIQFNTRWTTFFGLERGEKWSADWIEIKHKALGITINILAYGMTGHTRGINIDDYRPDYIIGDDLDDEESAATPEQRKKTAELWFGSLYNSLAPRSECPNAKMALLQTPLDPGDLINTCIKDPTWATRVYSIFDEDGNSVWEDRWPTEEMKAEKEGFIRRNQLQLWMREKECRMIGATDAAFREDWLRYYDAGELPERMVTFYGIDPVPPPSERALATGLVKNDFEVHAMIGVHKSRYYLLDIRRMKGHEPDWTVTTFFEMLDRWRPLKVRVEGNLFQKVLAWLIRKAMMTRRRYVQIDDAPSVKSKPVRIKQALTGPASNGQFLVSRRFEDFLGQFVSYPNVPHDDDLDAVALAMEAAQGFDVLEGDYALEDDEKPLDQAAFRGAP